VKLTKKYNISRNDEVIKHRGVGVKENRLLKVERRAEDKKIKRSGS
jgi:hypothetical protein